MSIVFIIGGFVLRANDEWFNGADTVGLTLIAFGGVSLTFQLLTFVGLVAAGVARGRS